MKWKQPVNADQNPAHALPELRRQLAAATTEQERANIRWLISLAEAQAQPTQAQSRH